MADELRKAADALAERAASLLRNRNCARSVRRAEVERLEQALEAYRAAAKAANAAFVAEVNAEMDRLGFTEANRKTAESERITEDDLRKIVT